MTCELCDIGKPHVHVEDCADCGKRERTYFDGRCARCHERRQFPVRPAIEGSVTP